MKPLIGACIFTAVFLPVIVLPYTLLKSYYGWPQSIRNTWTNILFVAFATMMFVLLLILMPLLAASAISLALSLLGLDSSVLR